MPVGQRRRQLVRSVDTTAVGNHDDLFRGFAEGRHHLMDIWAQLLGIAMGDDLIKDFRGPLLDGADDVEQHATSHAAPTAIACPRLAFAVLFAFDLAGTQGPCGQAKALSLAAPPARSGQGKPPEDGFICIQQNDLATLGAVLQSGQFARGPRQFSGVGSEPPCGTMVADVFFLTPRGRFRGSAALQSGGRARWPVPDKSTGNGWNRAEAGLGRRGDRDGALTPRSL